MDDYFPEALGLSTALKRVQNKLNRVRDNRDEWRDHAHQLEKRLQNANGRIEQLEKDMVAEREKIERGHEAYVASIGRKWNEMVDKFNRLKTCLDETKSNLAVAETSLAERDELLATVQKQLTRSVKNEEYFRHQANIGLANEAGLAAAIAVLIDAMKETSPLYADVCVGVDTPEGFEPARIQTTANAARTAALAAMAMDPGLVEKLMSERDTDPELPFTWTTSNEAD